MSVGAGTVADCWQITERGSAFSYLFVGQFLGPLIGQSVMCLTNNMIKILNLVYISSCNLGPIIGGGVTTGAGWRSVFWLCTGYGVFLFVFFFVFFPETYRLDHKWDQNFAKLQSQATLVPATAMAEATSQPSLLESNIKTNNTAETGGDDPIEHQQLQQLIVSARFNPFKSFTMMQYVFVCFVAIQVGFCFGTMFTLETLIPDLYYTHYGFDSWQTGNKMSVVLCQIQMLILVHTCRFKFSRRRYRKCSRLHCIWSTF
jgi:MFS family permease